MMPRQFHLLLFFSFVGLTILGLINIAVLDVLVYKDLIEDPAETVVQQISGDATANPSTSFGQSRDICGVVCQKEIKEQIAAATASLVTAITELQNKPVPTSSVTTTSQTIVQSVSAVKEYFVPLGAGSSTASDWAEVPGVVAYVDTAQYGKIKSVTFEVSLRTPTGNQTAYARLYNATDNHPIWGSEVSIDGGTPQLKISSPIQLTTGNKLYKVQMKTQLQFASYIDQARIHINTY